MTSAKGRGYVIGRVPVSVCLFVCLSVNMIRLREQYLPDFVKLRRIVDYASC